MQRLFFLRKLKEFTNDKNILVNFYRAIIESILTSSFTVWFGNATFQERRFLNRVVKRAQRIVGIEMNTLEQLYDKRLANRASKIATDSTHPSSHLFQLLPSGRRLRSIKCKTKKQFLSKCRSQPKCCLGFFPFFYSSCLLYGRSVLILFMVLTFLFVLWF